MRRLKDGEIEKGGGGEEIGGCTEETGEASIEETVEASDVVFAVEISGNMEEITRRVRVARRSLREGWQDYGAKPRDGEAWVGRVGETCVQIYGRNVRREVESTMSIRSDGKEIGCSINILSCNHHQQPTQDYGHVDFNGVGEAYRFVRDQCSPERLSLSGWRPLAGARIKSKKKDTDTSRNLGEKDDE
uniref:Uncharacterized protein n=1 Tax=Oryza punctata TaxID=4537 RepID=A0A0E0JZP1_ORYPU